MFVEEFYNLSAQVLQNEARLEEILRPQREKIASLLEEKGKLEGILQEKGKELTDCSDEKTKVTEIDLYIKELRAVEESEKERSDKNVAWMVKRIVEDSKTDPHLFGKAVAVYETITLQLRCSLCKKICSEENPIIAINQANKGKNLDSLGFNQLCLKCSDRDKAPIHTESANKMKDLKLINRIIKELKDSIQKHTNQGENSTKIKEMKDKIFSLEAEIRSQTQKIISQNMKIARQEEENEEHIGTINFEFEEETAKKDSLLAESKQKVEELTKIKAELEIKINSDKLQIKEKQARIDQMEVQLADLKDHNRSLTDELILKLGEIKESISPSKQKQSEEYLSTTVYPVQEYNQVCELKEKDGQIQVIQRDKVKEGSDFLLWADGKQLRGSLFNDKWTLSLYSGAIKVDTVEIRGNSRDSDKFLQFGNRIYIGVCSTYELYRLIIEENSIKVESFGRMSSYLKSVCEYKDYFFVGFSNHMVYKVEEGKFTKVLETSDSVGYLRVEDNYLFACDLSGQTIKYNLTAETVEQKVRVSDSYCFLFGDKIVTASEYFLHIYDWDGIEIKKVHGPNKKDLRLLKQTENHSVLAYSSSLLVIDHSTLETEEYKIDKISNKYLR